MVGAGYRLVVIGVLSFIATDLVAQVTWKRAYGGFGSEQAYSLRTLDDDGAIICGSTGSFGAGGGDMYVLRIGIFGEIIWSVTIGGPGVEIGRDIVPLSNGNFLVVGSTNSYGAGGYDGFAVMLNAYGEQLWQHTYGTSDWDFLHSAVSWDGGFLLVGRSYGVGDGSGDIWLVRTGPDGEQIWTGSYGTDGLDEGNSIIGLGPQGWLVGGTLRSGGTEADAVMIKYAADGEEEWVAVLGEDDEDVGHSVARVAQGGYVIVGYTKSFGPARQMFMAKVDDDGEELWVRNVSSAGNDWEARDVVERADGTFAVAGYTKEYGAGGRDFSLLFLDPQGEFISGPTYGGGDDDEAWTVDLTADGGYFIAGSTKSYGPGVEAVFVIRSRGDTLNGSVISVVDPVGISENENEVSHVRPIPQPVQSGGVLTLAGLNAFPMEAAIHDMQGRVVQQTLMTSDRLPLLAMAQGTYVLVLTGRSGPLFRARIMVE